MMNGAWITILPDSDSEEVAPLLMFTRFVWLDRVGDPRQAVGDKERQLLTQHRPSVGILVTDVSVGAGAN